MIKNRRKKTFKKGSRIAISLESEEVNENKSNA